MNDIDFGLTGNFIDENITTNPTLSLSIIGQWLSLLDNIRHKEMLRNKPKIVYS